MFLDYDRYTSSLINTRSKCEIAFQFHGHGVLLLNFFGGDCFVLLYLTNVSEHIVHSPDF